MPEYSGFREHAHTADWELEVWAPDLPGLFEQAARGMYELEGVRLQSDLPVRRRLDLEALDAESLLVRFLDELLYLQSMERLAFDEFSLEMTSDTLRGAVSGGALAALEKEIKAVTYHKLSIQDGARGLEVRIVFDV